MCIQAYIFMYVHLFGSIVSMGNEPETDYAMGKKEFKGRMHVGWVIVELWHPHGKVSAGGDWEQTGGEDVSCYVVL